MFVGRWFVPLVSSCFLPVVAAAGCSVVPEDDTIDRVFDPCEALTIEPEPGTTAPENEAVSEGIALWNDLAGTDLSIEPRAGAPVLPVHFDPAATAFRGLYDDENAVVFINSRMEDPRAIAITVAHELGHAFGLTHVQRSERGSLMNPGNLEFTPTPEDVEALAALWGKCPAAP